MNPNDEFEMSPHLISIESETAVLGSCLVNEKVIYEIEDQISPDEFSLKKHQIIMKAIIAVKDCGEPVDVVTVTKQLGKKLDEIGGVQYLVQLSESVPTTKNVDFYASTVREKAELRKALQMATELASTAQETQDAQEIREGAERLIRAIEGGQKSSDFTSIRDVLSTAFERLETRFGHAGEVTGIPSGYPDLDAKTAGFQRSDLIILAARPAVGKTAFALNVAQNVAVKEGVTVAIFSLEMGKEQLVDRMLCADANIDASRLRTGMLNEDDWPKLTISVGNLSEAPIFIDDTAGITLAQIRSKCRRLKERQGLGLVLIDYLQLIQGKGENRQQVVSEITRGLKLMARELNVPVIALSQLSRSVEQRADKRPMMSDLRESGSIEQDADIVAFLYRDEYYNPESDKKNIVEIIIAKQRSGPTGTVELVFLKNFNKFVSLERAPGA